MTSFRIVVLVCLSLFVNASCNPNTCRRESDCRVGLRCDMDLNQCVACLENSHCSSDEFCCQGDCKAISHISEFCGCGAKLNQSSGSFCAMQYARREADVGGPMCLARGAEPNVDTSSLAKCGCIATKEEECGDDAKTGLKTLCIDNQCVEQNSEHCGASGKPCYAESGGTQCLPGRDGSKYGICGCSRDDVVGTCQSPNNGHIAADACVDDRCRCGNGPVCRSDAAQPDCCGGQCRDFSSDPQHCGKCDFKCGSNLDCYEGKCECDDSRQCQTQNTDICALVDIPANNGKPRFNGKLCVCSAYRVSVQPNARHLPCPEGSFCCPVGAENGAVGCCSKPCDEAQPSECSRISE